jgi:uncharacterized alpha-E superfamily protein
LFWLGRYVHRAENDVRIARCLAGRVADNGRGDRPGTPNVLATELLGLAAFQLAEADAHVLIARVFHRNTGGPRSAITHVEGLIRALRDRVSTDAWRIVQGIERDLSEFDSCEEANRSAEAVHLLNRLAIGFLAFSGVIAESMTRGHAWRFLDMGNRVERAIASARLLRSTLANVVSDEPALLEAILEIADSSLTYRRRYFTQLDASAVVDLLLADEANPRSVAYQLAAIEQHLAGLPRQASHPQANPHCQLILQMRARIRLADLRAICRPSESGARPGLAALLNEIMDSMEQVAELVSHVYFSHAAVAHRLAEPGEDLT